MGTNGGGRVPRWRRTCTAVATVWMATGGSYPSDASGGFELITNVPAANLRVLAVEDDRVVVAPDLRDTKTWWFFWHFGARNASDRPVWITFVSNDAIGVRGPAVSRDGGWTWSWMGRSVVTSFHYRGAHAWAFPVLPAHTSGSEIRYAFCPLYLESHLRRWLEARPWVRVEELCRSRKGRRVERLHVGQGREVVWVLARHHACEAMASYVLEGFLDVARTAHWETVAVPFVDKDGVEDGDQGKNRAPHDHNRDYNAAPIYPEVAAIMNSASQMADRVVAFLDLHCPYIRGSWNDRVYLVGAPETHRWTQQQAFTRTLARLRQGPIPFEETDILPFGVGWNTRQEYAEGRSSSQWARAVFPHARLVTTIEIAYADAHGVEVTIDGARALGADLARALSVYLATSAPPP